MLKIVFLSIISFCAAIVFGYASAAAMSTVIGQGVIALIVVLIVINGVVEGFNLIGQSRRAAQPRFLDDATSHSSRAEVRPYGTQTGLVALSSGNAIRHALRGRRSNHTRGAKVMGYPFGSGLGRKLSTLSMLLPVVAALVLLMSAAPTQAASPPDGSYRQTCQNIKASSHVLKARCLTRYRTFVGTTLVGYRNCQGDIANDNGQLVCRDLQGDITLFEHSYFRGRSLAVTSDVSNLPRWFNDAASSVRVRRGSWQVCTDKGYRGRCETVRRDIDDLNRIGLNDRISSLRRLSDRYPGGGGQYDPPHGSYQQSCRDETFDGRYLSAECRDRRGRYEVSRLDTRTCERGDDIVNRDGDLSCENRRGGGYEDDRDGDNGNRDDSGYGNGGSGYGGNARLPRGSYQQSCRNMVFTRGTLSGDCRNAAGEWRSTSLDTRSCSQGADIGNANGQLTCAGANPPPPPPPLPGGSYQQSCRNMVVERGTLNAECKDAGGAWKQTSIELRACRGTPDIANDNGTLKCSSPPAP